jgi:ADP-heptose:LPS heptosyltransferase
MKKDILIGLVEHMGDIIACEPVLRNLKEKYPNSKITWVSKKNYAEILESNPYIDETLYVECLTEWMIISRHSSDIIIDLHINYRECECCRIPLYKNNGNQLVTIQNWYNYGCLLQAFSIGAGLTVGNDHPNLYIQELNRIRIDAINLPDSFIVIHRKSNDKSRDWEDEKWLSLINHLISSNFYIVEIGGLNEVSQQLVNNKKYLNLSGKLSILDSAELLKRSTLFIGIDSGPAHIANSVKAKSLILLGVFKDFKQYNPYSGFYSKEGHHLKFVRNIVGPASKIELVEVIEALNYLINQPKSIMNENIYRLNIDEDYSKNRLQSNNGNINLIAFYLPQFYPIDENNKAWGSGFVEWTNIVNSKPLFDGHHQPIEPGEFGYYDLRSTEILEQQAKLALDSGINAFSFYYYYSAGKRLMYRPLHNFLHSNIPMKFCITFANHNWTKKWDAENDEVIFEQLHDDSSNEFFIESLIEIFEDYRYLKIDGKPLLIIFMPQLFPDILKTTENWRKIIKERGFPDLYLVMVDDWNMSLTNPINLGFDATYEMPSNYFSYIEDIKHEVQGLNEDFTGRIIDYQNLADYFISKPFPIYKRFKTVMAPWDNTPRYKSRAIITLFKGYRDLENWLTSAIVETYLRYRGDERIVFIHSWNEWAEGTYIEPDRANGSNRIKAVKKSIKAADEIINILKRTDNADDKLCKATIKLYELNNIKNEANFRFEKISKNIVDELAIISHYKNKILRIMTPNNIKILKKIYYTAIKLKIIK